MGKADNLKNIVTRQKELLGDLEAEYQTIQSSDLTRENDELKEKLQSITDKFQAAEEKLKQMSEENSSLKNALYEQIYNEKLAILNMSRKKLEVYFKSTYENEQNRLTALENSVKQRIDTMTGLLKSNNIDVKDEIYEMLGDLSNLLNEKVTAARTEQSKALTENEQADFETLKNEQITDRMVKESAKKNNFESFIGLNLINKLGILLIIIGVIVASQYTFFKMPVHLKGIMMFSLGGIMLAAGEFLNRRKANIFSLGVTAGGVAVLYIALAASYFYLDILKMYPAIGLCVLITAIAFVLATRYNAQVILAFALVGGYLPIFSISGNLAISYSAMVYFVVLNLLALGISFKKKWTVSAFIGLILNIAGTAFISFDVIPYNRTFSIKLVTIAFILFAFLSYTLIPVLSTFTQKLKFKKSDVVLMGINTFFSSLLMYIAFYNFGFKAYTGILAIAFAVIYLLLGRLIETKFTGEKSSTALFYITGLSFVVLIIPFQFGKAWLTLGWLAEGTALAAYGILQNNKGFKKAGFIIFGLCVAAFLIVDVWGDLDFLFAYKYLAITLGSMIILGSYVYIKSISGKFEKAFKYLSIINLWIYSIYVIAEMFINVMHLKEWDDFYLCNALAIAVSFLIAYTTPRINILRDRGVKIISAVIYVFSLLWLFALNLIVNPTCYYSLTDATYIYSILGTLVLVVISLLSVLALYDLLRSIVMGKKLGVQWLPLLVSGYFVLILTQNLITQYDLQFSNASISIIYVVTALAWIIFGFAKRYSFLRRFGLGLSILAVAKLFLVDLHGLTQGYQIVTYFALGITLLAISFVYQYFNKRLELKAEVVSDEENN